MALGARKSSAEIGAEKFARHAGRSAGPGPSLVPVGEAAAQVLAPSTVQKIQESRMEGGEPLSTGVQQRLAGSTPPGASLGQIRLHRGAGVDELARELDTRAFTVGRDLFFAAGQFRPASVSGFHLLAHEAAHALQPAREPDVEIVRRAPAGPLPEETEAAMASRMADVLGISTEDMRMMAGDELSRPYVEVASGPVKVAASDFRKIDPLIEQAGRLYHTYEWKKDGRLKVSFRGVQRIRKGIGAADLTLMQRHKDIAVLGAIQANSIIPDILAQQAMLLTQAQRDVIVYETGLFVADWTGRCNEGWESAGADDAWNAYWGQGEWVKDAIVEWAAVAARIEEQAGALSPQAFSADLSISHEELWRRVQELRKGVNIPIKDDKDPGEKDDIREGTDAGDIEITTLRDFTERKVGNHLSALKETIDREKDGSPDWMEDVNTVLGQPSSAHAIDTSLALVIAFRESGPNAYRDYGETDTFHGSGLDALYTYGREYAKSGVVPPSWVAKGKNPNFKPGERNKSGQAAVIPRRRVMAFLFAAVGRARLRLEYHITKIFKMGKAEAEAMIEALPVVTRRIWVAISFGGVGGSLDLAAKPGETGVRTFLQAFHDANLPLTAIVDIDAAIGGRKPATPREEQAFRFLRRSQTFDRFTIAAKTALAATALD